MWRCEDRGLESSHWRSLHCSVRFPWLVLLHICCVSNEQSTVSSISYWILQVKYALSPSLRAQRFFGIWQLRAHRLKAFAHWEISSWVHQRIHETEHSLNASDQTINIITFPIELFRGRLTYPLDSSELIETRFPQVSVPFAEKEPTKWRI